MKKYLFIDNYRGFSNVTVPLVDVNFMVGENSSGKTSVLTLLRILSSSTIFMGPNFGGGGGEDVQFGHFSEVVSVHADDKSYFTVGYVDEREDPGKKTAKITIGIMLTYKEHSGIPRLSRMTFSLGNKEVSFSVEDEIIRFDVNSLSSSQTAEEMKISLHRWSKGHFADTSEWKELEFPKGRVRPMLPPLFFLLRMAMESKREQDLFPLLIGAFNEPIVWIAPIRTTPRRTYDEPNTSYSSEGSHTPYAIRRMLGSTHEKSRFDSFMAEVGEASGLFQSITVKRFGDSDDAPFEVDAVLDNKPLNLSWLGYGVSQSLPILVELLDRPRGSWFAIQQPEVHLHPRAQSALGDVFYKMSLDEKKRFVIETHSDFMIDRFRLNYRQKKGSKKKKAGSPRSQVLFFERSKSQNTVTSLPISESGGLPADQPRGYREFFIKEEMRLLDV